MKKKDFRRVQIRYKKIVFFKNSKFLMKSIVFLNLILFSIFFKRKSIKNNLKIYIKKKNEASINTK